jgi:hypothetical protein
LRRRLLSLSSTIRISRVMTSISRALSIIGTAVWLLLISTALMRDALATSKTNAWRNSSSMLMSLKVQLPAPLKLSDPTTHGRPIVSARYVKLQHIRKHGRLRQMIWIATQWAQVTAGVSYALLREPRQMSFFPSRLHHRF